MIKSSASRSAALFLAIGCFVASPSEPSGKYGKKTACAKTLASCPMRGCADTDDSPDGLLNARKRTLPKGKEAVLLTFEDFGDLQEQADGLVGQESDLSASQRDRLRDIALTSKKKVSEGELVELRGYIVQDSPRPKPAGPESVNCRLSKAANNDIHIPIVEDEDDQEFGAIVVEMIPQNRPDAWTSSALKKVSRDGRPVIVRGQLFYDNKHKVNGDAERDNGQPKRFSLWEIHPITQLWVCIRKDRKCGEDLSKPKDWKRLEDFAKQ